MPQISDIPYTNTEINSNGVLVDVYNRFEYADTTTYDRDRKCWFTAERKIVEDDEDTIARGWKLKQLKSGMLSLELRAAELGIWIQIQQHHTI